MNNVSNYMLGIQFAPESDLKVDSEDWGTLFFIDIFKKKNTFIGFGTAVLVSCSLLLMKK